MIRFDLFQPGDVEVVGVEVGLSCRRNNRRWGNNGFVFAAGHSIRICAMEHAVTPGGLTANIHGQCLGNWVTEIRDSMERPTENIVVDKIPFIDGYVSRVLVWSRYSGDAPGQF